MNEYALFIMFSLYIHHKIQQHFIVGSYAMMYSDVTLLFKDNFMYTFISDVQEAVNVPVIIGSGITEGNVADYLSANAMIVGSHLKMKGLWQNDLDSTKVFHFMKKVRQLRDNTDRDVKSSS